MAERSVVMVRVPEELIQQLREKFPELREEKDATVVRIVLYRCLNL